MAMQLEVLAGEKLKKQGLTLAVAESCTGGLLGSLITEVPGSSAYFLGGIIAYDDRVKIELLGVPPATIQEHGSVSAECALAMCQGARRVLRADIALSITGVAGPAGGTAAKPVGTTYIGLAASDVEVVKHFWWRGGRASNRAESVEATLSMLIDYLDNIPAQAKNN